MGGNESPFRHKLNDAERRQVVEEIAAGADVNRAAEKFGITPSSVWSLVYKAAHLKAMRELGLHLRADEYLRFDADAQVTSSKLGATDHGAAQVGAAPLASAAMEASAALRRLADAAVAEGNS